MKRMVEEKMPELVRICRSHAVRRLALFGSAASGESFDPVASDLDFVVEFEKMPPVQHAGCYFGLLQDLERLFSRPIDLIEFGPISNPYLLETVKASEVVLYGVA